MFFLSSVEQDLMLQIANLGLGFDFLQKNWWDSFLVSAAANFLHGWLHLRP
jgi:hypothetical protein